MRAVLLTLIFIGIGMNGAPAIAQDSDTSLYIPDLFEPDVRQDPAELPKGVIALKHFERCMDYLFPEISVENRYRYCGCTADAAYQVLPKDVMLHYAGLRASPDTDLQAIITYIEVPCLAPVIAESAFIACLADETYSSRFSTISDKYDYCECMKENIEPLIEIQGSDMAETMYSSPRLPQFEDPVQIIMSSRTYRNELGKWRGNCLNTHSYK